MNFIGNEYKIDVQIPTHIMKVSTGDTHRLHCKYQAAWREWKDRFEAGETLFGKINKLATDKFDATFWVHTIGFLHDGLGGRHRNIEASIKICDNASGYFFHKLLTDFEYVRGVVGNNVASKLITADDPTDNYQRRIKIDYYIRGSVDLGENKDIKSFHFDQITAVIPGLPGNKEILKEIFNPALRPYCPWEVQEKLDSGKFFE